MIVSPVRLNDGQWHKVTISRTETRGILDIDDGAHVVNGESRGRMKRLDTAGNIYFGWCSGLLKYLARLIQFFCFRWTT